jgi:hypothetical protein
MRRKPTDIVQINLRIRELERRKLEAAAKKSGVSLNGEMAARIARTFRQTAEWEANQLAENVSRFLGPLLADVHELTKSGELIRAADELIALIQPLLAIGLIDGPAGAEIRAAIERYSVVKRMIEIEAGRRLGKMNTAGAQP